MSVNKLSAGPACDGKRVFIEVTGLAHGPEHSIQFYDETDNLQQEALENEIKSETLAEACINSWDWRQQQSPRNAWLAITAESGVIKLPLYRDIQAKERREKEQDYQLHAVMPLTLLPSYNKDLKNKDRLAPVRNGYIYVFYNHKAWREIEIRTQDDGSVNLKDIDLFTHREGKDNPFKDKSRLAVGSALKEIWLPAKDNNKTANVHLAYSEVQWSAQYLNHLESDKNDLTERALAFNKMNMVDDDDVLSVKSLPVMRSREPETELFIAEPTKLNRDLSGGWLKQQYQQIKDEISDANTDGEKALEVFKQHKTYQYEYAMKQAALQQLLLPDAEAEKIWDAQSGVDYLDDAKQRQLRAIVLDDPLFDLRHHAFLAMSGMGYMQQVYVDMSKQEYYQSAELVQKFVMPKKFGKQDNPFNAHKDEFDTYLGGRFHRTLRTIERQVCCRDVKELQKHVESQMNHQRTARVLRDMSSLNEGNSAAAYVIAGYGISALNIDIDKLDPLSNSEDSAPSEFLATAQRIITSDSTHPLHAVLFPPEGEVTLEELYTPPAPFNSGSGFATTQSLALLAKDNFIVEDEQLQVMDLAFMSAANDNEVGSFAAQKRIANVTDGIFKAYFETLMNLSNDLASEAKVIAFNSAYAPVLGLLKATNAKMGGDVRYVPIGGAEIKGTVVGVHGHGLSYGLSADDREYVKANQKKAPMSRLYEKNGKLIAASGKNAFKKSDKIGQGKNGLGPKLPLKVVVVSADSSIATTLNQANTQRALKDINQSGLTASNTYEKLKVPYFIVVIEMINLTTNLKHFENWQEDPGHKIANIFSAVSDLSIAITHAANLYTKNASQLATASRKTAVTFSKGTINKFTFQRGTVTLVGKISMLNFFSIGAGFLTAAIAGWDAIRLFNRNDTDAALAMSMVSAGTLVTTIATGFFTTTAPVLFGMGPIAWLGISIAITGFVLVSLFTDTPIEVWLKNGPFGKAPDSDYEHLQDNQVAFNRFVGLLFSSSTTAYRLGTQTHFSDKFTQSRKEEGVTHVVWLNTNLASLLNPNLVEAECYIRQAIQKKTTSKSRSGISHSVSIINQEKHNLQIITQSQTQEGYAFFVKSDIKVPKVQTESGIFYSRYDEHRFNAALLIRARLKTLDTFLPGLALDEAKGETVLTDTPTFEEDEKQWLNHVAIG